MKLKTLAIAAATLAVGAITSQAQVYSQNVVGYVNKIAPSGSYVMICNPFTTGNDVLSNVLTAASVPSGATVQLWNGTTWVGYTLSSGHWKKGLANADNTALPPGVGFFYQYTGGNSTNTFAGSVVAFSGSQATNALGTVIAPFGSLVPYADTITNTATFNLVVAPGSTLQQWDVVNQKYNSFTYNGPNWKKGLATTNPVIQAGEGFFLQASVATNWIQNAP